MTAIGWRNYKPGDEEHITSNPWVDRYGPRAWQIMRENLRSETAIMAYTFVDTDGGVHGIGGFVPVNGDNSEVFNVINGPSLRLKFIPRAVRSCLHKKQQERRITRVFATCRADERDELESWFEYLGMEHEAFIEGWDVGGVDVHFYKRIVRGETWAQE